MRPLIIVCLKSPTPGRVKTRLAATVGAVRAVEIYRTLVQLTVAALPQASAVRLGFDPPEDESEIRAWMAAHGPAAEAWSYRAQVSGDLGQRLAALLDEALDEGFGPVTLVGTDCPEIQPEDFHAAWSAKTAGADVVFGPASDGGFWQITVREGFPSGSTLFQDIRWSTEHTLADARAAVVRAGYRSQLTRELSDIDTEADWQRWLSAREKNGGKQ
jgi:uncharacterized protein